MGLVHVFDKYLWVDGTDSSMPQLPVATQLRQCMQFSTYAKYTLHDCDTETALFVCDTTVPLSPGIAYFNELIVRHLAMGFGLIFII